MTKILAITDETHICECCGKTNLKRVVVIEKDNGQIVRYGTTCATKAMIVSKADADWLIEIKQYADKYAAKYEAQVIADAITRKWGIQTRISNGIVEVDIDRKYNFVAIQ